MPEFVEPGADPIEAILAWHTDAVRAGVADADAMALATATPEGVPSVRMVLYRGFRNGTLRFFTNYDSRKGVELARNPRAAVVLFWQPLRRQVRVEGTVTRVTPADSDAYFMLRERGKRLGAWASPQSRTIASRSDLEARLERVKLEFEGREVTRPDNWGGYQIHPLRIELWRDGEDRLHDRWLYERADTGWVRSILAP